MDNQVNIVYSGENYLKQELYSLIKSDDRIFNFIQESVLDGLWYWDMEKPENEWMNPRFWKVLGYNPDDMPHSSRAWQGVINPDDLKVALDELDNHCENPAHPYDQIVRYSHKNGSVVWIQCRGLAIRDESGKPVRMLGAHHNITQLKNEQALLQLKAQDLLESEKRLRFLVDNSHDLIWMLTSDGDYNYISPSSKKILGYEPDWFIGKSFHSFVHADDKDKWEKYKESILHSKDSLPNYQIRIKDAWNNWQWHEGVVTPVLDENETIISFVGASRNVTQQKLTETALIKSHKRLESYLQVSQTINTSLEQKEIMQVIVDNALSVTKFDTCGIYLIYNKHSIRMEAASPALPPGFPDKFKNTLIKDHPYIDQTIRSGGHVIVPDTTIASLSLAEQEIITFGRLRSNLYIPIKSRDKTLGVLILSTIEKLYEFSDEEITLLKGFATQAAHVIDNQRNFGAIKKNVASLEKHISERKRVENKLFIEVSRRRILMEQLRDGIVILDKDGKVFESNKKFAEMLGYSIEELKHMTVYDWEYQFSREKTKKMIKTIDEQGDFFETKHRRKDGSIFDIEISTNATWFDNQKLIFCVCRDITERKKAASLMKIRLMLSEFASTHSLEELLQKTLEEIKKLTASPLGFYHFVSKDASTITLKAWSAPTEEEYGVLQGLVEYDCPIELAGIWADSLLGKKPAIHNNYATLKLRKGLPEDHVHIEREIVVPIIRGNKVVALVGVGNKPADYTSGDVEMVSKIADFTWEIAASKRAEEEVRIFKTIADNAVYGMVIADAEGKVVYTNSFFSNIHGYSPEELTGMHFSVLFTPEQLARANEFFARLFEEGSFVPTEFWHVHRQGPLFPMLMSGVLIKDQHGNPRYVAATSIEITRQKKAEEANYALLQKEKALRLEMKMLLDRMSDGFVAFDANMNFTFVNAAAGKLLGRKPEDLIGKNYWKEFPEAKSTPLSDTCLKALKVQQTIQFEDHYEPWDRWFVNTIYPSPDGISIVSQETTEKKHAELTRQELEIAKQTIQFKQNFLANMSHEIRTPLTGVLGMIELLEQTLTNDEQKDYLNTLKTSGENLRGIINQVLDFSKIEAGKIRLNQTVFQFKTLIIDSESLYQKSIKTGVKMISYIDPEIPGFIKADRFRLSQVLNNLISNALKFTHEGMVTIRSSVERIEENRITLKIVVSDTGIGISAPLQKKLFLPFSQADAADVREYEGTGLGLSICRQLIELMGGEMGMESEKGKGSTFWFTFPAEVAEEMILVRPESNTLAGKEKIRILLAEDKIINQKVITLMLKSMGHDVILAINGQQAIKLFEPGKFDLILMDIQMPLMDGVTATRLLKEKYTNLPPIVGLSANAFEGDREKYMAMGMDEYLSKPLRKDDFYQLWSRLKPFATPL